MIQVTKIVHLKQVSTAESKHLKGHAALAVTQRFSTSGHLTLFEPAINDHPVYPDHPDLPDHPDQKEC